MLPKNFDKDLDENFKNFRYRKSKSPDEISSDASKQNESSFDGMDL